MSCQRAMARFAAASPASVQVPVVSIVSAWVVDAGGRLLADKPLGQASGNRSNRYASSGPVFPPYASSAMSSANGSV